jgi:hypothetical protein
MESELNENDNKKKAKEIFWLRYFCMHTGCIGSTEWRKAILLRKRSIGFLGG